MSEREILLAWLGRAAKRLRLNRRLRDFAWAACGLGGLAVGYEILRAMVPSLVLSGLAPLLILASVGLIAGFALRLLSKPTFAQAAGDADARAGLNDELRSAYWFLGQASPTPAEDLQVHRASHTAQGLDPHKLYPVVIQGSLIAAAALVVAAATLAWISPRLAFPTSGDSAAEQSVATPSAADAHNVHGRIQYGTPDDPPQVAAGGGSQPGIAKGDDAAWAEVEESMRRLERRPEFDALRGAVAARDAKRTAQLLDALQRSQPVEGRGGLAARPEGEQLSAEVAQGIMARLEELLNAGSEPQAPAGQDGADLGAQPAARITQGPPEDSMDEQWSNNPGRHSEGETALNTLLRSISRSSIGERQAVRGEGDSWQEGGRSNVTGGAMGRRVGVSQAGAGDGDAAKGNPAGDVASDPVLGQRTLRLEAQLQRIRVERGDREGDAGTTEALYAATQSQSSKLEYQAVAARRQAAKEDATRAEDTPLAYRAAVKAYFLSEHGKEQ